MKHAVPAAPATYAPLPPRAWTLQLREHELQPWLHHLALTLAADASESGRVRVFIEPLMRLTGITERNARWGLRQLRELGLIELRAKAGGRGYPSVWQLVEAENGGA